MIVRVPHPKVVESANGHEIRFLKEINVTSDDESFNVRSSVGSSALDDSTIKRIGASGIETRLNKMEIVCGPKHRPGRTEERTTHEYLAEQLENQRRRVRSIV